MLAKCEWRKYNNNEQVWVGKYANLSNLPHWHYDCEMVFIEKGRALVCVDGDKYYLNDGQCVFINSRQIHYIRAEKDSVLAFIMYDNKITDNITGKFALKSPLITCNCNSEKIYKLIFNELNSKKPFYEYAVKQLVVSTVIYVFRNEEISAAVKNYQNNDRFKQLLEDIDDNYAYYTFEKAADFMALSAPYFSKKFHTLSGMTFSQYLNLVKVEKATRLIKHNSKNLSMTQIADMCGFDTIRNFNRVFFSVTGYAPRNLPADYDMTASQQIDNSSSFNPTDKQSIRLE